MATQPDTTTADDGYAIEQFVAFLREESTKARDEYLSQERANALEFYNGEPFGDEEPGRSQMVTRDVAEVIDYMTVSILRTMVSGENAVEFEIPEPPRPPALPQQPGPDGQPPQPMPPTPPTIAQQATAAVSQEFFQGQDGYRVLHDWIKAGLLEKTSIAKVSVEEQAPKRIEAVVPIEALTEMQQQGAEIVGAEPADETQTMFRIAYLEPQQPVFRDYVVPNEEAAIALDARDLDRDCAYSGYSVARTLSQIAEMGFVADDLTDTDSHVYNDILSQARDPREGAFWNQGFSREGVNRKVWLHEEYSTFDLDGDGIAELVVSHRVGNEILRRADTGEYAIERVEEQPGVVWCPFPMPGRIVGQSLADKVMDIQRARSVLMRQGMDNLYQTNAPRMLVPENGIGDTTLDDLLTVRPGGLVRYTGQEAPTPLILPFAAQSAFDVMEVMAGEKESRTGITRLNQGLDADALNKTATGTALMQAQGQQIEEYIARNFAEGFARLMLKKYRLMRQFGAPMQVMIDGEPVQVDPRSWPESANVKVRVGLGSGRKEQRLQYRMTLLEITQAAMAAGSRCFDDDKIFNQISGLIADSGLGPARDLIADPSKLPPAPPQQDPNMAKVQADAMLQANKQQAEQAKTQSDQMLAARKMEMDGHLQAQKHEHELQMQSAKAQLDAQIKRDAAEQQATLASQKAAFEADLARQTADRNYEISLLQMERDHEIAKMKAAQVPQNRPGGDLSK